MKKVLTIVIMLISVCLVHAQDAKMNALHHKSDEQNDGG